MSRDEFVKGLDNAKQSRSRALFREVDLSDVDVSDIELKSIEFERCKLPRGLSGSANSRQKLVHVYMRSCVLPGDTLQNVELISCGLGVRDGGRTTVLRRCRFDRCSIDTQSDLVLDSCAVKSKLNITCGARAALTVRDSSVRDTALKGDGSHFTFCRARGLWGPRRLNADSVEHEPETAFVGGVSIVRWENLRKIGQLRLMSASYFVMFALIAYGGLVAWSRARVAQLIDEHDASFLAQLLRFPPAPASFGLLLTGIACIAAASSIYYIACPNIVKHYSLEEWTINHGKSFIEYKGASHHDPFSRVFCAALYLLGAVATVPYLAWKFVIALGIFAGWW